MRLRDGRFEMDAVEGDRGRTMKNIFHRLLAVCCLAAPGAAFAHTPHVCPSGTNDVPAMLTGNHIAQSDAVAGLYDSEQLFALGGGLAESRFNKCDGQGRPGTTAGGDSGLGHKRTADTADNPDTIMSGTPNNTRISGPEASSCTGCHAQPGGGGGGDFATNTFNGAEEQDPITMTVDPNTSNERGTRSVIGEGYIELISREMTSDLQNFKKSNKTFTGCKNASTHGVSFNVCFTNGTVTSAKGIDTDLIVKPFGSVGTAVSIREFTVNAANRHTGMQAEEAYDDYLGDPDYDGDGITTELTIGDITVMSMWQAELPMPYVVEPTDTTAQQQAATGQTEFNAVGCGSCHIPAVTIRNRTYCEPNAYNKPQYFSDTTQSVCLILNYYPNESDKTDTGDPNQPPANTPLALPVYTDLKRHHMCDDPATVASPIRTLCNEKLAQGRPDQDGYPGYEFFVTPALWGAGETGPYGHSAHFNSLSSIILAHAGEARAARDAFAALTSAQQVDVVMFLQTFQIPVQNLRIDPQEACGKFSTCSGSGSGSSSGGLSAVPITSGSGARARSAGGVSTSTSTSGAAQTRQGLKTTQPGLQQRSVQQ